MTVNPVPLGSLSKGEKGILVKINQKGPVRQRLMAMGLIKGVEITVEKIAPLGDPIDFILKDYHLSLRKTEANMILVVRSEE